MNIKSFSILFLTALPGAYLGGIILFMGIPFITWEFWVVLFPTILLFTITRSMIEIIEEEVV